MSRRPEIVLALNDGYQTPVSVLIAHLAYGVVIGSFHATP